MASFQSNFNIQNFNIADNIITDQDKIMWESCGLTSDVQSIENAAILSKVNKLT